uniref:Uncharacterized protein n=1 Tax=Anguilla anguilla TaxID=7936 RepID=A0A0E9WFD1_ANGAN
MQNQKSSHASPIFFFPPPSFLIPLTYCY